jgi:hypothetical protein
MKNNNYYDHFVDSILSLPPKIRTAALKTAGTIAPNNNPYLYLWNCYQDLDNLAGIYISELFDEYNLALD